MPKSPAEIEQEVRNYYKKLTETKYSLSGDPDAEFFSLEVTEEDIQKAIESYSEANQKNAQKYMRIREESNKIVDNLVKKYGIIPEIPFGRTVAHMMDLSGTPEAEQKNVELLRKLSAAEEYKKYIQEQLDLIKNFDVSVLGNKNAVNGVELFLNEETYKSVSAVFIGKDILDSAKKAGIRIPEEIENLALYNANLISSALRNITQAQNVLAKNDSACINPDIPAVKKILDNPGTYDPERENEAFNLLNEGFDSTLDRRPFFESDEHFKLNRLIEEKHLPKTKDLLARLLSGTPMPTISQDGKQQMAFYKNGVLTTWDRSITPSTLKPTDKYPDVQEEAVRLFGLIEREGLKNENNTKEFQRLIKAAEDLDAEFKKEKKLSPDTRADESRLLRLMQELRNSADSFKSSAPKLDTEDALTRKQLEFADTIMGFADTESTCRKAHIDALPHNVFAREFRALLSDPRNGLDFDVYNKVDSLRIRNFGIYKTADDQLLEQTDFLFTNYSNANNGRARYDQLISSDPRELLKSQFSMNDNDSEANLRLYQSVKSCNAVIYPKNGDPMGMRMLYVDKNGKPRISPPLGQMPNLGQTMAKMDRLRDEGKGFENFPSKNNSFVNFDIEAETRLLKERESQAKTEFYKDCEKFFPDAMNIEILVENSVAYPVARQNLQGSSYGEVYLTDDEKSNNVIQEAARAQQERTLHKELARRLLETNVITDALEHPEYYAKQNLADERIALQRAQAYLTFSEAEPEKNSEYKELYDKHHMETTEVIEKLLRDKKIKPSDLKLYNCGAGEIKGEKPWDKIEKAAELVDKGEPVYFTIPGSDKLHKIENADYEVTLDLSDLKENFLAQGDAEKRHSEYKIIEHLYNQMHETGTTSRDSAEYKGMVKAAEQALAIAKACDTDQPTVQSVLARAQLDRAKKKLASAANEYFTAKVEGSMNSRRSKRFAAAMLARHVADENYSELINKPGELMKEALATKICMTEARQKENNHNPEARTAQKLLTDRNLLKKKSDELQNTSAFKALTSDPKSVNKLFTTDAGKLLKKYNEKAAVREQGPVMN